MGINIMTDFDKEMKDISYKCMNLIILAEYKLITDDNMRDFINMMEKYRQLMINEYGLKGKD